MSDDRLWRFTDHLSRCCLARVMVHTASDRTQTARCSRCDLEIAGGVKALCCCGKKQKPGPHGKQRSAGYLCTVREPDFEWPDKVYVRFVSQAEATAALKAMEEE